MGGPLSPAGVKCESQRRVGAFRCKTATPRPDAPGSQSKEVAPCARENVLDRSDEAHGPAPRSARYRGRCKSVKKPPTLFLFMQQNRTACVQRPQHGAAAAHEHRARQTDDNPLDLILRRGDDLCLSYQASRCNLQRGAPRPKRRTYDCRRERRSRAAKRFWHRAAMPRAQRRKHLRPSSQSCVLP